VSVKKSKILAIKTDSRLWGQQDLNEQQKHIGGCLDESDCMHKIRTTETI
jgi:hypothetical protein